MLKFDCCAWQIPMHKSALLPTYFGNKADLCIGISHAQLQCINQLYCPLILSANSGQNKWAIKLIYALEFAMYSNRILTF